MKGPQPIKDPNLTCNSANTCAWAGDYEACTYSDGSRCDAYELSDNPIKIPFGKRVVVSCEYQRSWSMKPKSPLIKRSNEYKSWIKQEMIIPRKGIFLGYRFIRDGFIERSYDEGSYFVMDKQHKVALVCLSERENPIYVPLTCITYK